MTMDDIDRDFPDIKFDSLVYSTDKLHIFEINNRRIMLKKEDVDDLDEFKKTFNIPRELALRKKLIAK